MSVTQFILVRHGQTAWNSEGRYQGHLDSPLTAAGAAQARAVAARLAGAGIDALYSSDLERALQTARMIAEKLALPVLTDARLRERCLGIFQGLTRSEAQRQLPEEFRRLKSGDPEHVVPGGESARQRSELAVRCLEELAENHAGQRVLVVTHGGVVAAMFRHVVGVPPGAPRRFQLPNAGLNTFSHRDGRWLLETWGDVYHVRGDSGHDCETL